MISDIRGSIPEVEIGWVVEEGFADIPAMHRGVDYIHGVALRRWRKSLFSASTRAEILVFKEKLRDRSYDTIIDTQGLLKSAWITRWASGTRYGQHWSTVREPLAAFFYNHRYKIPRNQHAVLRNRQLVAKALDYDLPAGLPVYGISANTDIGQSIEGPYVVCLHGTAQARKLWSDEQWISLGASLNSAGVMVVLPWGTDQERERADRLESRLANAYVPNRIAIKELASLMTKARAIVGIDTGLAHLAVALGKPTIGIYTDTNPSLTGLYAGEGTRVINLGGISKKVVAEDVWEVLVKWGVVRT